MPVSAKARTTCATDTGAVTRSREEAKERRRQPEEDGDPEHVLKRRLEGARRQRGVEAEALGHHRDGGARRPREVDRDEHRDGYHEAERSEERRVGKECS